MMQDKEINKSLRGFVDDVGWVHCPICGRKTRTKVKECTVVKNFPLFCPQCGQESMVDIKENRIQLSLEPDVRRGADNL